MQRIRNAAKQLVPWLMWLMMIVPALGAAEPHNRLTDAERAAGWQLLFDGATLDGWRSYGHAQARPAWQVEDGTLMLARRGGGDLITQRTFDNFELVLEWRISEAGNSGVFILADEGERPIYVHAPEIQILDDARHPDNKLANHRSGSLYDLVAAPPAAQKPAGTWNELRILHDRGRLRVWQNGVVVVMLMLGGERWQTLVRQSKFANWDGFGENLSGHIGLQDHGDVVSFRNLKIRPLGGGVQ